MTSQEVVMHVIDKAKKSAWREGDLLVGHVAWSFNGGRVLFTIHYKEDEHFEPRTTDLYGLIFSHGFAKAFWGEQIASSIAMLFGDVRLSEGLTGPAWKIHLQQMVLQENPIDYLKRFI